VSIPIADLEDERIAPFRNLRDRDLRRGEEGAFVVEGEVLLPVLLGQRRHPPRAILVSDAQARRLADVLSRTPADVPIYEAPLPLLEQIVGFPMHRGVVALAARGPALGADALLAEATLVVALCGLTNHDNVGGAFRNAAAFGADAVLLDAASCDPLYRKAVRVSVGASMIVPFAFAPPPGDEAALVDALAARDFTAIALSPRGALEIGRDPPPPGKLALVLGAEGPGLSPATLARCATARIAMRPGWDSLNVATAGAVALHWARRA